MSQLTQGSEKMPGLYAVFGGNHERHEIHERCAGLFNGSVSGLLIGADHHAERQYSYCYQPLEKVRVGERGQKLLGRDSGFDHCSTEARSVVTEMCQNVSSVLLGTPKRRKRSSE